MQISDTLENPLELNPKLSKGIGWLIEKMLAKDKESRQKDWEAVLADIAIVKKRLLPLGKLAAAGVSTARKSTHQLKGDHTPTIQPDKEEKAVSPVPKLLIAGVVIGLIVFAYVSCLCKADRFCIGGKRSSICFIYFRSFTEIFIFNKIAGFLF